MAIKFKKTSLKQSKLFLRSEDLYFQFIDQNHILFKIKKYVDFEIFFSHLEPLYSELGQDGYHPLLLLKSQLLLELENIDSNRDLVKHIKVNLQYRHFLNLGVDDPIFDHSVLSRFRKRVGEEVLEKLFEEFVLLLRKKELITKSDERYMDAVHHTANVALVAINTLLSKSISNLHNEILNINPNFKPNKPLSLHFNEFKLNETQKKERFTKLVKLAQELITESEGYLEEKYNEKLELELKTVQRIIKERVKFNSKGSIEKENNNDEKGRLTSLSDKDATWGAKSKDKLFLGYKTNIISTQKNFVEVFSVHKGYKNDLEFFEKDIKKTQGDNISTDTIYGTLKNRKIAIEQNLKFYAPLKSDTKEHLVEQIMEDALQFSKSEEFKLRRKSHWNVERIFADLKNNHHFEKMRYRGLKRIKFQIGMTLLLKNMKSYVNILHRSLA